MSSGQRTIGLLGGMSWESSIVYERIINETVRSRLGGMHSADLLVRSYDFARIAALQADGQWEEAGSILAADAVTLAVGRLDRRLQLGERRDRHAGQT